MTMDPNNLGTFPNPMLNQNEHIDIVPGAPTPLAPTPRGGPLLAPPQILSGHPNLWNLLAAFKRRLRLGVGLGLLVGVVAAAVTAFFHHVAVLHGRCHVA